MEKAREECSLVERSKPFFILVLATLFIIASASSAFSQTDPYQSIKGVKFKDGTVIMGTVTQLNVETVTIRLDNGQTVVRKFDDVDIFIKDATGGAGQEGNLEPASKTDDKFITQAKKEIFNIAIGAERMSGNTTYQIGYPVTSPNGTQYAGYFPFSKLEWPLDIWLARMDASLNIGDSWRINGVLKKNLSDPGDTMKDSDWITPSNPGRLDVYSESNISNFDALIFDIDVEWIFLKRQPWSLYAGLGYLYQKFDNDATLIRQYSPSGLPGFDTYGDGRVGITYEITYTMPYLKIGGDYQINDKFILAGSFAWSPIVKAQDEDHHLLRKNGGKISTGDMDGNAYMINLSAKSYLSKIDFRN